MNKLLKKLIGKNVTIEGNAEGRIFFLIADGIKLKVKIKGDNKKLYIENFGSLFVEYIKLNESIAIDNFQTLELSLTDKIQDKFVQICVFGYTENSFKITEVENEFRGVF